jgi:hypothetical protein
MFEGVFLDADLNVGKVCVTYIPVAAGPVDKFPFAGMSYRGLCATGVAVSGALIPDILIAVLSIADIIVAVLPVREDAPRARPVSRRLKALADDF